MLKRRLHELNLPEHLLDLGLRENLVEMRKNLGVSGSLGCPECDTDGILDAASQNDVGKRQLAANEILMLGEVAFKVIKGTVLPV